MAIRALTEVRVGHLAAIRGIEWENCLAFVAAKLALYNGRTALTALQPHWVVLGVLLVFSNYRVNGLSKLVRYFFLVVLQQLACTFIGLAAELVACAPAFDTGRQNDARRLISERCSNLAGAMETDAGLIV